MLVLSSMMVYLKTFTAVLLLQRCGCTGVDTGIRPFKYNFISYTTAGDAMMFSGRQREVAFISSRLLTSPPSWVILDGTTNVGKTSMLRHLSAITFTGSAQFNTTATPVFSVYIDLRMLSVWSPEGLANAVYGIADETVKKILHHRQFKLEDFPRPQLKKDWQPSKVVRSALELVCTK
jgi:hypothetical protein